MLMANYACCICLHDMIMIVWPWYFWGNSLSFGLIAVDYVSGISDERGKAKA